MKNRHHIEQELSDLGVTLSGTAGNPYRAPEGYFEALPREIMERVRREELLASASGAVYAVPEGYFPGLAAQVLSRIHTGANDARTELEEVAPLLNTLGRENVYTVPQGYFATVNFARKALQPEAKVFTLRIARKWMQYAAAAVMAGILVTGAFVFTNDSASLRIDNDNVSSAFNSVDEADLVKYLDNPDHFVAAPAATSLASEEELADVKTTIQKFSDDELNQYLKENAESLDASLVSEKE